MGFHDIKNVLMFFENIKDWDSGTQVILMS